MLPSGWRLVASIILLTSVLAVVMHEEEDDDIDEDNEDEQSGDVYKFLYKRMQQDAKVKKRLAPSIYSIPGPQEPLPGRSHSGDYWPVFPFQNQYSGGLDLDPSISRHIGGDLNLAVPSWGMLDIYGRFFNRIHDTTTKFGYINHPVNMMDLEKEDMVELMTNPSNHWNRAAQPTLPLGKLARQFVPLSCKPPLCNPYHANFGFGMEHDYGGNDGVEGDIDVPLPLSKGVAYRFPFSGKVYYFYDNVTVTYGHNLSPVDPFNSLFDYQNHRDPRIVIPRDLPLHKPPIRRKRQLVELINNKSNSRKVHPDPPSGSPAQTIDVIATEAAVQPVDDDPYKQIFYPIKKDTKAEDADYHPQFPTTNYVPVQKDTGQDPVIDGLLRAIAKGPIDAATMAQLVALQQQREEQLRQILLDRPLLGNYYKMQTGQERQLESLEQLLRVQLKENAKTENILLEQLKGIAPNLELPKLPEIALPTIPLTKKTKFYF